MDRDLVDAVTREVVRRLGQGTGSGTHEGHDGCIGTRFNTESRLFQIGISNRHLHLSRAHMDVLFGEGSELTVIKELIQPGQFAAKETVMVVGPKGSLPGMRIVGPLRNRTQVEISRTDGFALGVNAPVRVSGDLEGTASCALVGPKGMVILEDGVIVAQRHVHLEPARAERLALKDQSVVKVAFCGDRGGVLENFVVRIGSGHFSEIHLDTDEANALGVKNLQEVEILY